MTETTPTETGTQVLELSLGDNRFAIDISVVDEIVERKSLTPIPNAPEHVAGVMDLRGETTRIVDPKVALQIGSADTGDRVIILETDDSDQVGWIVDGVYQVFQVDTYEVEDASDNPAIEGIIHRNDEFVMWLDPNTVLDSPS
ncbi:MAG: chemotaxis protein CheW [Halodesulfurarchaeum sp.]